ncbi:MAG: CDP-alcohol phosphatidyltransferase family protein [Thermoplasmata archaeon]
MAAWSRISVGDLFTLANGVIGFVAITYILDEKYLSATGLLMLSLVMDGLDGLLARRYGSRHSMGQVLDSISDSISFAFAPALLVYAEFRGPSDGTLEYWLVLACSVAIIATGLFRLARFSAGGYQLTYFVGMPAPAAALLILLTCLLFGADNGAEGGVYYFPLQSSLPAVMGIGFLSSYLMASEIPYPKPKGWMATASAMAVLAALIPYMAGLAIVGDQDLYRASSRTATAVALAMTAVYVFGGPLYEKVKGSHG